MNINKFTKIILICAVLLVAFSVFYYFVIFLPQKDKAQLEQQQKEQLAKEEKEKEAQRQAITNKLLLESCLNNADESYRADWAMACKINAQEITEGIQRCMIGGYLSKSDCEGIWGKPNDSPDCSLPGATADRLEERWQQSKDNCFKMYPQK